MTAGILSSVGTGAFAALTRLYRVRCVAWPRHGPCISRALTTFVVWPDHANWPHIIGQGAAPRHVSPYPVTTSFLQPWASFLADFRVGKLASIRRIPLNPRAFIIQSSFLRFPLIQYRGN